jgi:hypothetical protein
MSRKVSLLEEPAAKVVLPNKTTGHTEKKKPENRKKAHTTVKLLMQKHVSSPKPTIRIVKE